MISNHNKAFKIVQFILFIFLVLYFLKICFEFDLKNWSLFCTIDGPTNNTSLSISTYLT